MCRNSACNDCICFSIEPSWAVLSCARATPAQVPVNVRADASMRVDRDRRETIELSRSVIPADAGLSDVIKAAEGFLVTDL